MNAIYKALEDFLERSTPEQLRAELQRGNRQYLQSIADPILITEDPKFSFPATVSFYQGEFGSIDFSEDLDTSASSSRVCNACEELALAA